MKAKLLRHGSVKDIWETSEGNLLFSFSDRFSVFDWGKMPESIPGKGDALFHCARTFFRLLSLNNIKHHVLKIHDDKFEVQKFHVPKIVDRNYDFYKINRTNVLVPLECIFRFESFKTNEKYTKLKIDFTTKLETTDRALSTSEAQVIAGLSDDEFKNLNELIFKMALILKDFLSQKDLVLIDGKFEFALDEKRNLIVVDSFGPDEWRVRNESAGQISKEFLRQFYRSSTWYLEIEKLKTQYSHDWKNHLSNNLVPPSLPQELIKKAQDLYQSCADFMTLPENKVVILGSGGREHALALSLSQSMHVDEVYVIPGNPGMKNKVIKTVAEVNPEKIDELKKILMVIKPTLVIPGPEKLLELGIVDQLQNLYKVLGPTKLAAQIESSKIFSKELMEKCGVPTAPFKVISEYGAALPFIDSNRDGVVVKADGLCAGKGVIVCHDKEEAKSAVAKMLPGNLIIEKKIRGREVSVLALCSGEDFKILGYVCDHKRLRDGDQGPNTGGMGCFTPKKWPNVSLKNKINEIVFAKILAGLKNNHTVFNGILFAGLMIDGDDIQVLEYNARLGDPETQTLLPLIQNDLYLEFLAAANGKLLEGPIKISDQYGVTVVLASPGYAETELKQDLIIPKTEMLTFYAGVTSKNNQLVSVGGRVLSFFSSHEHLEMARSEIYQEIKKIKDNPFQFRHDIGASAHE